MSRPILEQLYDGEIYPAEQIVLSSPEAKEAVQKLEDEKAYFYGILSKADRERFDDLFDLLCEKQRHYSYADFSCGFKLGTRLAYAALGGDTCKTDHEREVEERFDREMREALLEAATEE